MIRFDDRTTARGIVYYLNGHVGYLRAERNTVVALVEGSRPSPYTVFLNVERPDESRCTCPVGFACKHLVATAAAVLNDRLPNARIRSLLERAVDVSAFAGMIDDMEQQRRSTRPTGRSDTPSASQIPAEYTIDVEASLANLQAEGLGSATEGLGSATDDAFTVRYADVEAQARWRVAFLVGHGYEGRPMVALARQYRRKDGAYGRVEAFRDGEAIFAPPGAARDIAERLRVLGGNAPLLVFADELADLAVPVFAGSPQMPSGAQEAPVDIVRPDRLEIEVVPYRAGYGVDPRTVGRPPLGGDVELALVLHIHAGERRWSIDPGTRGGFDQGMGRSLASFADSAGIVVTGREEAPPAALKPWFAWGRPVPFDRLPELQALASRHPEFLSLRYPARISVVNVDPAPVFVLSQVNPVFRATLERGGSDVADGYYGDEFRIHRILGEPPREAIRAASDLIGDASFNDHALVGPWTWDVVIRNGRPDLVSVAFELSGLGYPVYVDGMNGRRLVRRGRYLSVRLTSGTDWFAPSVSEADGPELDWRQLVEMTGRGGVDDGESLVLFHPAEIERIRDVIDATAGAPGGRVSRADLASLLDLGDLADEVDPDLDSVRALAEELIDGVDPDRFAPPAGLTATLRPYQRGGFAWLATLARHGFSGCLADDMGLGKTVQALALMLHLNDATNRPPAPESAGGHLVIAPVSTLRNWEREAERFAPELVALVHHGAQRAVDPSILARADLVITSYATAARDAPLLGECGWRLIVLDEAQFIKNPHARTAKRLKSLPAHLRLCLTGTPVENVSTDLWSIMDFLSPGLLGSLPSFTRRFPKRNTTGSEGAAGRLDRLRRIVSPFLLRRTKEAVAPELPPRTETVLTCEMSEKQARFYETLRVFHRSQVERAIAGGDSGSIGAAVFTGLLRLRQAALYPADADPTGRAVPSVKEQELIDQLEEIVAEGNKALVFSQFVSALERLRAAAIARGVTTLYLDGKTRKRTELIDRFQNASQPVVFFISLKAGGTGINLTAADYVYICDPWWNPQVERQAVDRAHRIGRQRPVMVTRLVTAGTVEQKVLELQEQKRQLASDLICENAAGLDMSSADELLALFE